MKNQEFMLERGSFFGKSGKKMYNYFVSGMVDGDSVTVNMVAKDTGGYGFLEFMYKKCSEVKLIVREEVMTNEKGGSNTYTVFEAQSVDGDGLVYTYKLKPAQESDKAYLNVLMQVDISKEE